MPKISVIIPAYNAEKFIEKCVNSVLNQSFTDLELIIVNDGSTDSTAEKCAGFAGRDSRVRVINQKNAGVSCARNAGLDTASGELIAFVDADDWLEPTAYEEMLAELDKTGAETVICNFSAVMPDGSRVPYGAHIAGGLYSPEETSEMIVRSLLCGRLSASFNGFIWCYLFSGRIIRDNNIRFTGAYLEDELFLIEYFASPRPLCAAERELYCYYQNPSSVTRRYLKSFTDTFETSMQIKRRLVEDNSIDVSPDWENTTLWAGLFIAVGNEFAPGNPASGAQRRKNLKALCETGIFAKAVNECRPVGMGRNKSIVAALIRMKLYGLLAALYEIKNRNRS